jgi:tRNA pseudouridine32 synthase/23S rRNA pseudouridine746 synthase
MSDHTSSYVDRLEVITETLRTRYWSWILIEDRSGPMRLLTLLHEKLPQIDPKSWRERFCFGGVYVNGHEALDDMDLPIPCKVEYYEPKFDIANAKQIFPEFKSDYIIYRDEDLIAVYKPPGLSSMPAKEQRHFSIKASVENITGITVHMPSRLDVSAQGLLIMSTSQRAHARLQQSFEHRRVTKEYRCASASIPTWRAQVVNLPIGRDQSHPVLRKVDTAHGKPALTEFSYLTQTRSNETPCCVFRATPTTGRTHQIRVHAAACGIPLLGDRFYLGASAEYLHLVSYAITLNHPATQTQLQISVPSQLIPEWAR